MNLIPKALRYGPIAKGSHSCTCHSHEPYLPLLCKHSSDGTTPTEVADIRLQLATHLSTPKGWKAESAWLVEL